MAAFEPGEATATLFWDPTLGPPPTSIAELLDRPDDAWHAGHAIGGRLVPRAVRLADPTAMHSVDTPLDTAVASWRVSLRACLVRNDVLVTLGMVDERFDDLGPAGLDLGLRWLRSGARVRYEPDLVGWSPESALTAVRPSDADEVLLAANTLGARWSRYVAVRSGALRWAGRPPDPRSPPEAPYTPARRATDRPVARVAVLIPTIDRYPYLRTVLGQLRDQTRRPDRIVVVDQTPPDRRDPDLASEFADLPIEIVTRPVAGQSTARNAGLSRICADAVLFIDDDDEIDEDLIARHLANLEKLDLDVSSGAATEPGGRSRPVGFDRARTADVLPTNNSLVRRSALDGSGWFDEAYDHGPRADHDLGMRLHLSGARMWFDPDISVLHHRAPAGGLRTHGARRTTYAGSRSSIWERHRLAATERYLWGRYYDESAQREAERLRVLGVFAHHGPRWRWFARIVAQTLLLPDTLLRLRRARAAAAELAQDHPTIPGLTRAGPEP